MIYSLVLIFTVSSKYLTLSIQYVYERPSVSFKTSSLKEKIMAIFLIYCLLKLPCLSKRVQI